ncbi:tripartite tricarboxylate transporter TctB family protein [Fulvimarina sp. 2208YS6-2-32]|uniref:Tripartite tricarboxylate transporter TctB family protein n=1 Tax=Fulvimarina uroteuthidis TaxID=3098149 RepID=A0ABU5I1U5_9HYPH|nr:tripartite tricarboxylate transporter TctB family protein [Fulvimarina sp. 2208YS6-2-32]MDY8108141.1 tripartite tricarboxylate transporter TctB family protein [Fulvimarina sp. 2208YS6-2-32]
MTATRAKELVTGIAMLGIGLVYLFMTMELPDRGTVDAATIPYVLAFGMVLLGLLQCISVFRGPMPAPTDREDPPLTKDEVLSVDSRRESYVVVALTLALVALYTALLRPIGFPFATAAYLFLQFWLLTPKDTKPPFGLYALIAGVASGAIFLLFRYAFDLLLPAGPLTPYLP